MSRPPDINPVVVIIWTATAVAAGFVLLTVYIASVFWLCRAVWNLIV